MTPTDDEAACTSAERAWTVEYTRTDGSSVGGLTVTLDASASEREALAFASGCLREVYGVFVHPTALRVLHVFPPLADLTDSADG